MNSKQWGMLGFLMGQRLRDMRTVEKAPAAYLIFASAEPFTIGAYNATKNWDGTLYYSTDTATWNEWDGTTAIASAEDDGEHKIYMRGSGNTRISGEHNVRYSWVLTGNDIRCVGNIENLLDYEIVAKGEHPTMGSYCFSYMFRNNESLISTPSLSGITLSEGCYRSMFVDCVNLTTIPELPATTLVTNCYGGMFGGCSKIKLSETKTDEYVTEYRMPPSGKGTVGGTNATLGMFIGTGGTYKGNGIYMVPLNTTFYTSNTIV